MKKIILAISALSLFAVSSCNSDQFLDTEPTQTISTPPVQAKLNGLYTLMINTGTGGTTGHDDFGQKGYDIFSDLLSSDMALEGVNYGWYSGLANFDATQNYANNANYEPWRYYYRIIAAANDVIDGLGGNDKTTFDSPDDQYGMGQAKAMRAYGYYYLLQLYTDKYDPSSPSIPLYIQPFLPAAGVSTQSDVYGQITKDLTESIGLLDGFKRANKGMVNKYVAEGLLAYTYAAMGEYDKVIPLTDDIINNGGFAPTNAAQALGGFNDLSTPSWMWGFDLTLDNGLDLVSWWGQIDVFSYSYAWAGDPKGIDLNLFGKIQNGDIRKDQFKTIAFVAFIDKNNNYILGGNGKPLVTEIENLPAGSEEGDKIPVSELYGTNPADVNYTKVQVVQLDYPNVPINKFYDPARVIGGQREITTDYIFMRVDEFYLLRAEALAYQGPDGPARTALQNYLVNNGRMKDASYLNNLNGQALKDEIYNQTRIEFWGEGKSYLALKRNKQTNVRGSNHLFFVGDAFSYDNPKLTLRIPQSEVQNNPNMK